MKKLLFSRKSRVWAAIATLQLILTAGAIAYTGPSIAELFRNGYVVSSILAFTMVANTVIIASSVFSNHLVHFINTVIPTNIVPKKKVISNYDNVTIILPVKDEPFEVFINHALKSALEVDYPEDKLTILVIDNSSSVDKYIQTSNYISNLREEKNMTNIHFVHRDGTIGKKARNLNIGLGLKPYKGTKLWQPTSDLYLSVDADVRFSKDILKNSVPEFQENKRLPFLTYNLKDVANTNFFDSLIAYKNNLYYQITKSVEENSMTTFWGQCTMFRRSALEDVNGFSEDNVAEDTSAGFKLRANPNWDSGLRGSHGEVIDLAPGNLERYKIQQSRWAQADTETTLNEIRKGIWPAKHIDITDKIDISWRNTIRGYLGMSFVTVIHPLILATASFLQFNSEELSLLESSNNLWKATFAAYLLLMSLLAIRMETAQSGLFKKRVMSIVKVVPSAILHCGAGLAVTKGVVRGIIGKDIGFKVTPKGKIKNNHYFRTIISKHHKELIFGGFLLGVSIVHPVVPFNMVVFPALGYLISPFADAIKNKPILESKPKKLNHFFKKVANNYAKKQEALYIFIFDTK